MKLIITRAFLAMTFLCLFASCSTDELEVTPTEKESVEISADLVVENDFAQEVLAEINTYRSSIGLNSLAMNNDPKVQALNHTKYMASLNKISHDNFFQRSDYLKSKGAVKVSENVAFGYYTAQEVVQAWLKSPGHKAAIEGDFTHTGISVVENDRGVPYFTQIFVKK
tara:strand:- start:2530 stop:3033 length:504 start_codon:yes stop_codon:yes gene_type:complete